MALRFGLLAAFMALSIFCAAGTAYYWQGWAYLADFCGSSLRLTVYLFRHDRALLERRLRAGPLAEKTIAQRTIMVFASAGFIALLIVPALDYRLGWSRVSPLVEICGLALVAIGFYVVYVVYRVNTFSAATIQVEPGQTVISTGPYALVRHPMYVGSQLMFLGTPLALGSYWGLLVFVAMMPVFIWRQLDEERFLAKNLPGYADYQRKVRWRLIPGLF